MLNPVTRTTAAGLVVVVAGCAAVPPPQIEAWLAAGRPHPPAQSACPGVANLNLVKMAEEPRPRFLALSNPETPGFVVLPDMAESLIPGDAEVVIRANLPPGGLYSNEVRSVVWKAADGTWHVWRQDRKLGEPPPPPPPPPPAGAAEDSPEYQAAMEAAERHDRLQNNPDERWPPQTGRLALSTAAALEAALADPCRAWDPDYFPFAQPLRRAVNGNDSRLCPQDGGYYAADITEPGRARRGIGAACINDTPTFSLISATAYAEPAPETLTPPG